jgi:hypothetical protein
MTDRPYQNLDWLSDLLAYAKFLLMRKDGLAAKMISADSNQAADAEDVDSHRFAECCGTCGHYAAGQCLHQREPVDADDICGAWEERDPAAARLAPA